MKNVEVNVGPQINCADTVESIEINDSTTCTCKCCKVSRKINQNEKFIFF